MTMFETVVTGLGQAGDGEIRLSDGRAAHVPYALPGERIRVDLAGAEPRLEAVLTASAARASPPCPHFGVCGGCRLQHMGDDLYRAFKHRIFPAALAAGGIADDVEIAPTVFVAPASRRRVTLHVGRGGEAPVIGFHRYRSHDVEPIRECHILSPGLAERLPALLAGLTDFAHAVPSFTRASLTETEEGPDLDLTTARSPRDPRFLTLVQRLADRTGAARISVNRDAALAPHVPTILLAGVPLVPPPASFLQPSREGEAALQRLVREGLPGKIKRVADLFAGVGTFALALSGEAAVDAFESDAGMVDATRRAASGHGWVAAGRRPLKVEARDLFRRPLMPQEVKGYDGLVLDPPWAGAAHQCERLAGASVPVIVYVSCHPAALARDAAILTAGRYRLKRLTAVDQFVWSPHIEAVAVFARER